MPIPEDIRTAISREDIINAAKDYDKGTIPHNFGHSTTYDVIVNGDRYPPKAIIGIASSYYLNGIPLTPDDFNGGLHTQCFNILEDNKFTIVLKNEDVIYPDEVSESTVHTEGSVKQVIINRYERDPDARDKCIGHYGLKCQVCDFDFEKVYGDLGAGFIHVHHLVQLSDIQEEYIVDPIKDLRPVCPNCHAMIHKRKKKPYTIDELKDIINRQVNR